MAVTKSYRVYGVNGHRQRESFNDSYKYDFLEKLKSYKCRSRGGDALGFLFLVDANNCNYILTNRL